MRKASIALTLLTLIGCNSIQAPAYKQTIDTTDQSSKYWFNNSADLDSSRLNELTENDWLLFETDIVPDSIQIVDLSNSEGLLFAKDTSTTRRTVVRFHSDSTIKELTTNTNGKWSIIHEKNINIQWEKPIREDISGQYSIDYLKNKRLHLFRGSHEKRTRTTHLFRKTN